MGCKTLIFFSIDTFLAFFSGLQFFFSRGFTLQRVRRKKCTGGNRRCSWHFAARLDDDIKDGRTAASLPSP